MKALSLWQPFASLWVAGLKINETRSWHTNHRGPLCVCASKKWTGELRALCYTEPFQTEIRKLAPVSIRSLPLAEIMKRVMPLGQAIGVVNVTDSIPIDLRSSAGVLEPERSFGDFAPGRYRWPATAPRRFLKPFPVVGRQGFFEIPDDLIAAAGEAPPIGSLF